ncbi:transcription factor bHLH95 [Carex littledalei]|uniref:Transcription factor bHLH95 n=1 Tax=Carex littledalei TaxID=544730 RepID=A0A833VGC2_9POAL|nr:transcription factor bHLH95 [Carex littledalei]
MIRGRKRRISAGTRNTNDSLVSNSDKEEDDACGGKKRTSDGLCSFKIGGGKEKEVAVLIGGSHKSGNEASRRNRMKDFFSVLHTFLPNLPPKIGRAELAEETANYIKLLEHECQDLEKRKQDRTKSTDSYQKPQFGAATSAFSSEHGTSREALAEQISKFPFQTDAVTPAQQQCFTMHTTASPNVVLSVAGPDAHVSVCAPKTPGLISAAVHFLEKHDAEVLSVQVCSDMSRTMFVMHAHVSRSDDSRPAEERFKLAKEELILWLGSSE